MNKLYVLLVLALLIPDLTTGCKNSTIDRTTEPPIPPTGLLLTVGDSQITITWTTVAGADSYNIYYDTSPGVTKTSNKIPGAKTPHIHTGLTNGTVYYYFVTAVNVAGESDPSSEISAIPSAVRLSKTGQTTSYASEDDGSLQKGTPWPDNRFVNLDGTTPASEDAVRDTLTGLVWTRDANAPGPACTPAVGRKWQEALDYITCLNTNNYLGYSDWRLPNRKEIRSLMDYSQHAPALPAGHPFINTMSADYYWTSTTEAADASYAWVTYMNDGRITINGKLDVNFRIWPVRTGDSIVLHLIDLPVTGQTASYAAGDDGSLQLGVVWPSSRFNADLTGDCVIDSLTGLVWPKAPDSISRSWADALTHVSNMNTCGYSDWRVPNINELESLIHAQLSNTAAWLNTSQGFNGIQAGKYWSATTHSVDSTLAWYVTLDEGYVEIDYKASSYYFYVLPVRGGQSSP